MYAPIALFVYNRLELTKQTIAQLLTNTLAYETDLYIFSDGGKDDVSWAEVKAVREYLHELEKESAERGLFKSVTITERPCNYYLERNIIEGINEVFTKHDTIIVLEDDIFVSEFFLDYMNTAFNIYKDEKKVMHVSGFSNLDLINEHPLLVYDNPYSDKINETYFTPHMSAWGWGTWRDRWQEHFKYFTSEEEALKGLSPELQDKMQYGGNFPCLKTLKNNPIPWDICWEIAIYKADGLCLTPGHTTTRNIGLHNGTHFKSYDQLQYYNYDRMPLERLVKVSKRTPAPKADIEALFAEAIKDWGIVYTPLGKVVRFLFKGTKATGRVSMSAGSLLKVYLQRFSVWFAHFSKKAGKILIKITGKAGVIIVKIAQIIWKLLCKGFKELVRLMPYVVGFLQNVFRLIVQGIQKLINKIMTKM